MLRTILFYFIFFLYMIYSLGKRSKLNKIRKTKSEEEAQNYINISLKKWADFILKLIGAQIELEGVENIPKSPCLFVSNHQGFLDIPIIVHSVDRTVGFIAKKEIIKFKLIAYWMKQIKCVFIDRKSIRESMKSINEAIQILKGGHSMVIFPEGTRSKGPRIGEFKKGSLKLALKAKVPIVPIAIDGSYKLREGNKYSIVKSAKVKVTICKPIYTDRLSKEELSDISNIVRQEILRQIYIGE
ncbi:lysophospholipid acyltransferase family protein [Clostridium kluyveri]|uniref:1-acyl-sn-glycerol-3-phosphate acyltransferase n=1 Tax=Clostridium kluyveri TaxID=1534 RepID=A0A1L5F5S0_CLOKL|nr:lysophospholipid acyltransferase family protein [Clostridium kluyveri]APM38354.1 1-acyl-sn-glycerol-3-phosphate acyltransferase [Clostridium kluyveri]UZQ50637.1 1-acyl-sn-glycerol-3-phosphate acyltransferase [Clostridium kluyveri]